MIPIIMTIIGLSFIAYLTYDTMTSIKAVLTSEFAWYEMQELAKVFAIMWVMLATLGVVTLLGVVDPLGWLPFV